MSQIQIVVDSSADFTTPTVAERNNITIVPNRIHFGSEMFLDGTEMMPEEFFSRIDQTEEYPRISPPTVEDYTRVYQRLSNTTDKIISLHISSSLNDSLKNAKIASQALLGRCEIVVLDSLTTTAGLGLIAEMAAKTARQLTSMDEVVQIVRGLINRTYSIYYVDSLDVIRRQGLLGEAQAVLGAMLGIKPFLTIEDGHLMTMEKVRTRAQAIEKMIEFVLEFNGIEQMVILQNAPFITEAVRLFQDRLKTEVGRRKFPVISYGPTLGCYLGMDATGLIVLEKDDDGL